MLDRNSGKEADGGPLHGPNHVEGVRNLVVAEKTSLDAESVDFAKARDMGTAPFSENPDAQRCHRVYYERVQHDLPAA
ncbi:hypothetical protein BH11ARM2_BH11ARM2_14130 [soil metagenome]